MNRTLTVAEVADRYGVDPHTVLLWIKRGELKAINCGRKPGSKKPRWRITPEALATFELCRTTSPPTPRTRRRRQPAAQVIEFY
jgi:excisionase family DNA binding protein